MNSGVYQIINQVNGKRYIGSSVDLRERERKHLWYLTRNEHPNQHLQNAINKYSLDKFTFEILEFCEPENCVRFEQEHMDRLQPEYNLRPMAGSNLGVKLSEKTRIKMSVGQQGRKHPPETRAKMSAAAIGRRHSDEAKAKMSTAKIGHTYGLGRKVSNETRAKMSAAQKKRYKETIHE